MRIKIGLLIVFGFLGSLKELVASNVTISSTSYNSPSLFSSLTDGDTVFVAAQLRTDGTDACTKVVDFSTTDVTIIIQNGGDIRLFTQCWLIINDESEIIIQSGGNLTNAINNRGIIVVNEASAIGVICASGSGNTPNSSSYPAVSCIGAISNINNVSVDTSLLTFSQIISNGGLVGSTILPVDWISFTAQIQESQVLLEWQTASEINCSHFEMERSSDGIEWTVLGEVAGHGTSSQLWAYAFLDHVPLPRAFYRIAQYDFDGQVDYSKVIPVQLNQNIHQISFFPNPSNGKVAISAEDFSEISKVELYATSGVLITSLDAHQLQETSFHLTLNTGSYVAVVEDINGQKTYTRLLVLE